MDPVHNIPFMGMADPASATTHGLAAAGAAVALVPLWRGTAGDPWRRFTCVVFGVSNLLLFSASTAYHAAGEQALKLSLRRFDHASIYVLIAGTFTPIAGNLIRGRFRAVVLGIVWALALAGIVLKTCFAFGATPEWVDVAFYLGMGWFGAVPCYPILKRLPLSATGLILGGAFCYSIGALVELFGKPVLIERVFSFHELFHLAVMIASVCFYLFVFRHVLLPLPASLVPPEERVRPPALG